MKLNSRFTLIGPLYKAAQEKKFSKVSQFWTRGPVKVQNDTKF